MKYEFETINCNACGSNNCQQICEEGKFGLPTNVVLCKECGLGYLNPRWNNESYMHFYRYEYDKYYRPKLYDATDLIIDKENHIIKRLESLNLMPNNVDNILDIGSGEGQNIKNFKSRFIESELYAIEPSLKSQKHLEKIGVTIISDNVDSPWSSDFNGKFDIIIMRHVLEHFMHPVQVLKKINDVLSPSGIVYIAVPNNLKPTQNLRKSWFRNVHAFYFNKYSLKNLLDIADLKILKLSEGDEFNNGEIFLIAKKSDVKNSPQFSKEHFLIQYSIFKNKLMEEKILKYTGIVLLKKIVEKILSLTKNKRY